MPRRKKTEGKYPIEIAEDIFDEGNATLADTLRAVAGTSPARVALVADANVVQRTEGLGLRIGKYFKTHGITLAASPVVVSGGEKIKADGLQSASLVATSLVDARIGANDAVIALGGGTVLDLAGYAAAQTRGGIKVIRMPTTPAAMIDAAFADAAAVNSAAVKDAFSVRCEPAAVLIDPTFARTVLDGVWCAGFGEAVRYAAVCDAALMKRLAKCAERIKARDFDAMRDTVADCVKSRGGEAFPPFAQWCAARLESMSGYKLPHGYAVAIAICIDCAYADEGARRMGARTQVWCDTASRRPRQVCRGEVARPRRLRRSSRRSSLRLPRRVNFWYNISHESKYCAFRAPQFRGRVVRADC